MKVEYSHNNSGGNWWLKDEDWETLSANGWEVNWYANRPKSWCDRPKKGDKDQRPRFLDALASGASKEFPTLRDAIVEWERLLGYDATAEGCNCCGAPHTFSGGEGEDWVCVSGSNIAVVLYGGERLPYRELMRRLAEKEN